MSQRLRRLSVIPGVQAKTIGETKTLVDQDQQNKGKGVCVYTRTDIKRSIIIITHAYRTHHSSQRDPSIGTRFLFPFSYMRLYLVSVLSLLPNIHGATQGLTWYRGTKIPRIYPC